MRKFKVEVIVTKEYEIEIDDDKISEEDITEWEQNFYDLDEEDDKIKSMAHDYCKLRAMFGDDFIEGYGFVNTKGKMFLDDGCYNTVMQITREEENVSNMNVNVVELEE